jgi:hypothetical protein
MAKGKEVLYRKNMHKTTRQSFKKFEHKKTERWGVLQFEDRLGFYWTVTVANVRVSSGGQRYEETPSISQITYISGTATTWLDNVNAALICSLDHEKRPGKLTIYVQ